MRIYEASIAYKLVQLGDVSTLNTADKVADYMFLTEVAINTHR